MSLRGVVWAWDAPIKGKPVAKLVLMCLVDHANEDGECFPSQRRIADRVGVTVKSVQTNLAWLEAEGFIRRGQRRRNDGSRTSDLYRLPRAAYARDAGHVRFDRDEGVVIEAKPAAKSGQSRRKKTGMADALDKVEREASEQGRLRLVS